MWPIRTQRPRILGIALLAGLVLAGRVSLATHIYEHDMAESVHECVVCEFGHLSKDDLIAVAAAPRAAAAHGIRHFSADAVAALPSIGIYLARAPPSPFV